VTLEAQVGARVDAFELDVALHASAGETVALLGPNAAGKTTLLRCLAGIMPLAHGRIVLDDVVLDDAARVFVPPDRRSIGVVFQDYLLFEHLSARENIAFGPRARGATRSASRATADEWLERLGVAGVARKKPLQLSGGEAQRVALARALATRPALLLLDEPLSALDAGARGAVRRDLRRSLAEFDGIRILVTHDPVDAAVLADRLVIIEAGRVVQTGTLAEITARPRSRYVAELVGMNLLHGTALDDWIETDGGVQVAVPDAGRGAVFAVIHPSAVTVSRTRPSGSARNVWPGRVEAIEDLGSRVRVRVRGTVDLVAEITPTAVRDLGLDDGADVWTSVKAAEITTFPA
jgi:molybdate transport system ATP-binding protein